MEESLLTRARGLINTGPGRVVAIVLALAAVAAAVTVAVRSPTSTEREAERIRDKGINAPYVCKGCGVTGKTHKPFGVQFPIECHQCRRQQAVAGFPCFGCKRTIEAVDAALFRCPHPDCRYVYDQRLLAPPGRPP